MQNELGEMWRMVRQYQIHMIKRKMTISIGVYCSKIDDESADKVVSYADAALYEAKNSGRNKVCYYYH